MRYFVLFFQRGMTGCLIAALLLLATSAPAEDNTPSDAEPSQPQQADAQPSEAAKWLTRIEQRADKLDTLTVKLHYDRIKGLLGAKTRRVGTLKYKAGSPVKFAVHFNKQIEGNRATPIDRTYIFDGRWFVEKRPKEKFFKKRELVPEGEERGLFEMNNQPFVLPLDQDKAYVLERFNVKVMPAKPDGPKNSVHLRLTPSPDINIKLKRIDLWYDKQSLLPKRAVTVKGGPNDAPDKSVITVLEVDESTKLDEAAFDTTPPEAPGWRVEIERLKDQHAGPPTNEDKASNGD